MIANTELMGHARESLSGKWGIAIGTTLVYMIVAGSLQMIPYVGPVIGLVIGGPFALGYIIFAKNISRGEEARLEQIFDGFKHFGTALATNLLVAVAVIIGMLFFIIPGIILALGLSQSMFIISDDREIGAYDALRKSWEMMKGYKTKFFGLGLLFFGLALLSALTLFIGLFWLIPFMQVTLVKFYDDVNGKDIQSAPQGDFLESGMS